MRSKFLNVVRTNEALGRFLELIVHTPPGKHETVTPLLSAAILERWMRALVA
jgi:hypothetical protein